MQAEKNHKIEREVEDYVVKTKFADELAERLKEKAAENGEQFDKGKEEKEENEEKEEQKNESEEVSSYYDTEEDDENEEVKKDDQENRNIANFIEKKATGVSKPIKDIEDSEMIQKMRKEWEQIQGDPNLMDKQLKDHLKMLDEISKGE